MDMGKRAKVLYGAGVALAVVVGYSAGGGAPAETVANPEPAPTVTVEPEPAPTVTVTPEPEVIELVPVECLTALDEGQRMSEALEFMTDWTGRYLNAVSELDTARMQNLTQEINDTTASGEFTGVLPGFRSAADACRAADAS